MKCTNVPKEESVEMWIFSAVIKSLRSFNAKHSMVQLLFFVSLCFL